MGKKRNLVARLRLVLNTNKKKYFVRGTQTSNNKSKN